MSRGRSRGPASINFSGSLLIPEFFIPPVPPRIAIEDMQRVLASPSLLLLSETPRHVAVLQQVLQQSGVTGNLIHDAHIVALCLEHGVSELLTGDRDFSRFAGMRFTDPFANPS